MFAAKIWTKHRVGSNEYFDKGWMWLRPQVRRARLMSLMGHVWTAPWQVLSDVAAALVGCGHVSGLLMRQVWPLALMPCADRVPIENTHFKVR